MNEIRHCPECHTPLSGDALEGLCPTCLFDRALEPASMEEPATTQPLRFVPPKPAELAEHFPQLDILDLIGHGGMGAVYKARQIALDRFVALKIIHPETAKHPTFAERFSREARALAQLNHPSIVGVHDFGRAGGMFYLIMELVDGVNLKQLLADGQMQPDEALSIIPQICEALEYAHSQGVVHRDIKPANVLISKQGRVKIADFGLAKLVRSAADDQLTGTQQVMGTPQYMSPEQMERPQEVDHRSDIYSLGVVLYEMLTGELPLGRFEPPSKKIRVDVRLDDVVLRSLEKQPARRYQHASELKTDVEAISTGKAPINAAGWSLQLADLGGLLVVLVVFALVGFGMAITGSADSMWGLIVLWWFIAGFRWSPAGKTMAGMMGVFLALLAIGFAVWVTGGLMPLWALLGVFWFASEFGWTESGDKKEHEDEDEDEFREEEGEYTGPIVGLNRRERQILRQLKKFDPQDDDIFFVLPSIPKRRLKNARIVCAVPPGERILGLFDFTFWGSARKSLVFGRDGVYFYCGEDAHPDGPSSIPYDRFAKLSIANAGDRVNLDKRDFLALGPCSASCEKVTNVLIAIGEIVERQS